MIFSMTGYGKKSILLENYSITIEIKSLNKNNIDITTKIPNELNDKEIEIKKIIEAKLKRGKIYFNIYINNNKLFINKDLISKYIEEIKLLNKDISNEKLILSILKFPDNNIFMEKYIILVNHWNIIKKNILETLNEVEYFRIKEGENIKNIIIKYINKIKIHLNKINKYIPEREKKIKKNITQKLKQSNLKIDNIDKYRLEQEFFFYLEKMDISEEKERLNSHLIFLIDELNNKNLESGKKIIFIIQEIIRETNTLGAKSNHIGIQKEIINIKQEIEKIKEQSLNIL